MGKPGSRATKTPPLRTQTRQICPPVNFPVRVLGSLFLLEEPETQRRPTCMVLRWPGVEPCSQRVSTSVNHLMQSLLASASLVCPRIVSAVSCSRVVASYFSCEGRQSQERPRLPSRCYQAPHSGLFGESYFVQVLNSTKNVPHHKKPLKCQQTPGIHSIFL